MCVCVYVCALMKDWEKGEGEGEGEISWFA